MDDSKLVERMEASVRQAIDDYFRHTAQAEVQQDISDNFIWRLACDSVHAKSELREMLRKSKVWDENLQALVINGTRTHEPDYSLIHRLAHEIFSVLPYDLVQNDKIARAIRFFDNCDREEGIAAIMELAPDAYRPNRKKSRIFKALCDALGVTDETRGSQFQRLFAWIADEMNSKKINYKLFLSINPAHFLTMSNPKHDARGSMLTSCHSFNSTEYPYNAGCTGYARDDVTMIAFTVDDPDIVETLNNRKTTRQLFMYKPGNGLLLQSRLYNTHGGTTGAQKESALYRDLIQREISEAEGAVNLWKTEKYCTNQQGVTIRHGAGFGGYSDWVYTDFDARISIRLDCIDTFETFEVGDSGLCVICGEESSQGLYCRYCEDEKHFRCDHCGEYCTDLTTVYNSDGEEIDVCESCLDEYYTCCDDCGEYHYASNMHCVSGERYVCEDCFENNYTCCEDCGEYYRDDDGCLSLVYDADGCECYVCENCRESEYEFCEHCQETYHHSLMHTFCDEDGNEIRVCDDCLKELEEERQEA